MQLFRIKIFWNQKYNFVVYFVDLWTFLHVAHSPRGSVFVFMRVNKDYDKNQKKLHSTHWLDLKDSHNAQM